MAGALTAVFSLPAGSKLERVSLGPTYVLLHLQSKARLAWSPTERRRIPLPLPGLFDAAALDDGRAVLWVEPNRLLVRGAGVQQFVPVEGSRLAATELRVMGGEICLHGPNNRLFTVTPSGSLVESGRSWKDLEQPVPAKRHGVSRELAIKSGVPISGSEVLVEEGGAFTRIDMKTGEELQHSPALVAGVHDCQLLPMGVQVVAICRTGSGGSVVIAHADSTQPTMERSFTDSGKYFAGDLGTLMKEGSCDTPSAADSFVVCVRAPNGTWSELSMPHSLVSPESVDGIVTETDISVRRWIPTLQGGAFGIVKGPVLRLLDLRRGVVKSFPDTSLEKYPAFWSTREEVLHTQFRASNDGEIEGYADGTPLHLTANGKLEASPQTFANFRSIGAYAIALDAKGGLWQSRDYGRNWLNVALPPGQQRAPQISACSLAGCDLGSWYRLGYAELPPDDRTLTVVPPADAAVIDAAPQLNCFGKGAIARHVVTALEDSNGNIFGVPEFGALWTPVRRDETREAAYFVSAISNDTLKRGGYLIDPRLTGDDPMAMATALAASTRLRYHEPFTVPRVRETTFTWQAVHVATKRALGPDSDIDYSSGGTAIPVMSRVSGKTEGIVLRSDPFHLWLRANKQNQLGIFPAELTDGIITSAAVDRGGSLLLALSQERVRIVKSETGGSRVLLEFPQTPAIPPNPDVLAIAADGAPAILRILSEAPPTIDDPALVLSNAEPLALAPWSTLKVGDCEASDGYRAIVVAGGGWLGVNLGGTAILPPNSFLAMVHWNQQRVCLEAVEFPTDSMTFGDTQVATSLAVRFGPGAFATRYAFDMGVEYTEPFECQLQQSPLALSASPKPALLAPVSAQPGTQ